MTRTALDIIKVSLGALGEVDFGAALSSDDCLNMMNMMLNSWGADGLNVRAQTKDSLSIAASASSYTIGIGAILNTAKPLRIISGYIRDSNSIDTPLTLIGRQRYDAYSDKTTTGTPRVLFYDPGASQQATQAGTIFLYPIADVAYTLVLESEKMLSEIATLQADMTFELFYEEAIWSNLCFRLAPRLGKSVSHEVAKIAKDSLDALQRINAIDRIPIMDSGFPTRGGGHILTDD